jgi:tryptophan-rich sensory protein
MTYIFTTLIVLTILSYFIASNYMSSSAGNKLCNPETAASNMTFGIVFMVLAVLMTGGTLYYGYTYEALALLL